MPVAAGVVGDPDQAATGATLGMAAEPRRAARFDRRHDAALDPAEMAGMGLAIGVTVTAEHVRHLQGGRHDPGSGRRHDLQLQAVERARRLADEPGRDPGVARRARQVAVTGQHLDDADVGAVLQEMRGEAVPQRVHRTRLPSPAAAQAERQAECSTCTSTGRLSSRPGNSQVAGRASRQ